MLKKITLSFILVSFFALVACSGNDYDWMSGSFGGDGKLSAKAGEYSSTPAIIVETKTGSLTFNSTAYFTMGDETPLPGCHLQIFVSGEDGKFRLTELDRAHKGQSQDMQGCLAQIGKVSARVDITDGWIKRDKDGTTTLSLTFKKRHLTGETASTYDPLFEYELRSHKTSWFW